MPAVGAPARLLIRRRSLIADPPAVAPEHLDAGLRPDEPLAGIEDLRDVGRSTRHGGDRDLRALPQVLMVHLGDRHREPVPEALDDRTEHRALRLQGVGVRHVQIDLENGGVGGHGSGAGDLALLERLDDVAGLEVLEVGEADAALEAGGDLADVVLEPAQRPDRRPSR